MVTQFLDLRRPDWAGLVSAIGASAQQPKPVHPFAAYPKLVALLESPERHGDLAEERRFLALGRHRPG